MNSRFFSLNHTTFASQSAKRRFLKRPAFTLIGPFMRGKPTRKEQQTCLLYVRKKGPHNQMYFYLLLLYYLQAYIDEIIKLGLFSTIY